MNELLKLKEETGYNDSSFYKDLSLINSHSEVVKLKPKIDLQSVPNVISNYQYRIPPKITCGIITLNESRCISRCIESVLNEVDEVIVIDGGSTDGTYELVKGKYPLVKLHKIDWNDNFAEQRNNVINLAKHDWLLFLDADEFLNPKDTGKLKRIINIADYIFSEDISVCMSPLIKELDGNSFYGVKRLFKISSGIRYYGKIHEEPLGVNQKSPKRIDMNVTFYHDGYSPGIMEDKKKIERNKYLLEKMIIEEPNNPKWLYFYARDSSERDYFLNENNTYQKSSEDEKIICYLEKALDISMKNKRFSHYIPEVLILLCNTYLRKLRLKDLQEKISLLELNFPNCIETQYFKAMFYNFTFKYKLGKTIKGLVDESHGFKESFIDEKHSHLKYSLLPMYFSIGNYEQLFKTLDKIDSSIYRKKGEELILDIYNKLGSYLQANNKA